MVTTPVPVKQTGPTPASMPDVLPSFRTEIDRLFDRFTGGFGFGPFSALRFATPDGVSSPAIDIAESDSAFTVTAELPGMTEKDIEVSLSGDTLTIKGEKRQQREENERNYHLSERSYGSFRRAFVLPDGVDGEKVAAEFANGVLTVTVPKAVRAAPKKIEVKAAA